MTSSTRSVDAASFHGREEVAQRVQPAADDELGWATHALAHVHHGLHGGAISVDDVDALEAELLAREHLDRVTLTRSTHAQLAVVHSRRRARDDVDGARRRRNRIPPRIRPHDW